ncbi:LGFP repeat OS=Tsukamurella paurometabola (strain ATCC 8368 / DSM / CCUG 35730 / CIP 100753/ JCM 10117 / KCTC 9821 / NBRC 16120 / NCIMB 702349 / NCTC 13040)OX=521096 GN=Tpau_0316 PE=4 SV=1 [Tsukamurella paurometabola]|uniref:LGFP repeat n=1 Tax=Tsukamurella paurometabola (strain ATCC 8368 / DSM 20162 / CCUG 35730 / CIP 100753 / JCM 10117 / KCTC 9821 / NBRC 16120 / NCIMB 702349 / NCTC 13040) TaxID=521096 RepID=D5URA8_TSUPD|nr:hypothetical protein [Tsukamurella paurometabola]ADG76961.1 conserved hypothetical protein [Tsukamurella paurometabola DSM 20162]SUP42331.1 LGFP repeat [Tsukamurella paurometabola]
MKKYVTRRFVGVIAGLGAAAVIVTGCSNASDTASSATSAAGSAASDATAAVGSAAASVSSAVAGATPEAKVKDSDGKEITLIGPVAAKYNAATPEQRADLGAALTGERSSGKRDNGVVFQQFKGGVIVAKNNNADTPAFITWGKIRDAWNVNRDTTGNPAANGANGSVGPLGVPTSDETTEGTVKTSTFEHGKITFDTTTGKVEVTVNGKQVAAN